MTTPFPFVAAQTLTAQQLNDITNLPINDQTASYTAVVGDAGKRIVMNVASANTVTINNSIFTTGDTIFIANKGAGVSTITAGAGVTINTSGSLALAQHGGGTLVALSASVFTFFSGGAVAKYVEFLSVAGGGGGGAGVNGSSNGGGGGGGTVLQAIKEFALATNYTITVGAGGASNTIGSNSVAMGLTSLGGGRGGSGSDGGGGGHGGGGSGRSGVSYAGGAGLFSGGAGDSGSPFRGGGGGGGSANGATGAASGNGGNGLASSLSGSSVTYAGGGGGGGVGSAGAGGTGGGGAGSTSGVATAGTVNTGGGGGGSNDGGSPAGGAGGSGVVILSYPSNFTITIGGGLTGTTTTIGTNKVTTITAGTGNVQWN
jgi:hypothetical protein